MHRWIKSEGRLESKILKIKLNIRIRSAPRSRKILFPRKIVN